MTGTPGHSIKGNINVASGAAFLNFNPATAGTVNLNGPAAQTINLNNTGGTLSFTSNQTLVIANPNGVTFSNGSTSLPTTTINAGSSLTIASNYLASLSGPITNNRAFTVNNYLSCGSNIISGTGAFTLSPNATLGIGDPNGITSGTTLSGNIQVTGGRSFSSNAIYQYNGTVAQATGNGLPSSVFRLEAGANPTLTLTSATTVTSELRLNSGAFSNGSNLTMGNGAQITRGNGSLSAVPTFGPSLSLRYSNSSPITTGNEVPASANVLTGVNMIGSGTVTLGGDATINGTLALTTAQTLAIGANTLTLNGDIFVSNGTLVGGASSNLVFGVGGGTTLPAITLNNLTINRAAGVTLGGATTVGGTLTLTNGTLTNGANLTLGNAATIIRDAGALSAAPAFGSSVNLTYAGTNGVATGHELPPVATTLNNLTVNKLGGVTLGAPRSVAGALTLTSGLLSASTHALTVGPAGTAARTNGYVVGTLRKDFAAAGSFTFPVGTANGYSPVDATVTTGSGTLSVRPTQAKLPAVPGTNALNRYWTLTGSGLTADLTFHYLAADVSGTEANYNVLKYDGSAFSLPTGQTVNAGAHTASVAGVSSFSDWTLADPVATFGTIQFSSATYSDPEGDSGSHNVTITVTRTGGSGGPVSVHYATSGDTATGGGDYADTSGDLNWADGDSADKTFTVTVNGDTDTEPDETVTLTLIDAQGGALLGSPVNATLTIANDDAANTDPTVSDIGDQTVTAGNSVTASFTVGDAETDPASLTVSGASSDQTLLPDGNITFGGAGASRTVTLTPAAGQTGTATVTVTVKDGGDATASDQFTLTVNPAVCTAPPAGMVAWYAAEGAASDIVGSNEGTAQNGAAYASGKVAQAFDFDGVDDSVTAPDAAGLDIQGSFSADAWVFPRSLPNNSPRILNKDDNGGPRWLMFLNQPAPTNSLGVVIDNGVAPLTAQTAAGSVPLNRWSHVAFTYEVSGNTGTLKLYVNGVEAASATGPAVTTDNAAPLVIGNDSLAETNASDNRSFDGLIDEVEVFNTTLSAAQVAAIYNASTAGKCHASTFQFSSATYAAGEGGGNATVTVTRTGAHDDVASVDYAAAGDTATGGAGCTGAADFVTTSGTLSFAAGDTSKTFQVTICDDAADEPDETVNLTLSNVTGTGAALGTPGAAALTINDDDAPPPASVVYVDDDWAGTTPGADPDGAAGPATAFGYDAFATIQDGVNGVTDPGTVIVRAGTYTETVTVGKQLSLRGAQFGVDARARAGAESVVNGAGGAFVLTAGSVALDGFTVQDATATTAFGVSTGAAASGYQIRNNIIKDNRIGLYLKGSGATQSVVEKNVFRDNNKTGGTNSGNGLFSDGVSNALIQNNLFAGSTPIPNPFTQRSLNLLGSSAILIKTNAFEDGNAATLSNVDGSEFSGNALTGVQPAGSTNVAGLSINNGTDNLLVSQNTFTNRGNLAAISSSATSGSNLNVTVTGNVVTQDVTGMTGSRIVMSFNRFGGTSNITENSITLTGSLGTGAKVHGMDVSGSTGTVGTVNILRNTVNGGNTDVVNTSDASVGLVISPGGLGGTPTGATINVSNNFINGWINAVSTDATGFGTAALLSTTTLAVTGNDLSGNASRTVVAHGTGPVFNASANWHGSTVPATVNARIAGASVDYTPYLNAGADAAGTAGFQGDFSSLTVHASGNQFGAAGRIQEGIGLVSAGGTVKVLTGTYGGNVDATAKAVSLAAGASPGQVTINGNLTLDGDDTLPVEIEGPSAATQYDNFVVNGAVTLGGAALSLSGSFAPAGQTFTIVNNDGADAIAGTFNGLPEGATITNFIGSGRDATITYAGGDGNDVVITVNTPSLSIDDVTMSEGDSGTTSFTFTVTKTGAGAASVDFTTVDGTATVAASDYQSNSGTLNFTSAQATQTITVLVNGDPFVESDEAFTVHLSNAANATVSDADGTGTIQNDDTAPSVVYVDDDFTGPVGSDPDGDGPAVAIGHDAFSTVQAGVNAVAPAGTVNVLAGTYHEDVDVNNAGLKLLGAGADTVTVSGAIDGPEATVQISASSVTVAGLTITRDGNNTTDWNNPGLNSAGVAISGLSVTSALVRDNVITGNRIGVSVNNSSSNTIRNNTIDFNRTGVIFSSQTFSTTLVENFIRNNWTVGVLFLDGSGGTNSPQQSAEFSIFSNNDISGNWYGQVVDRQAGGALPAPDTTNLKNFRLNWWGTTAPVVTTADSSEPDYAAQIPVAYGGSAAPPGGQPDIAGPASANIKYLPLLLDGADTDVQTTAGRGTNGFQGAQNPYLVSAPNQHRWTTQTSGTAAVAFVTGPGTPPLGAGSGRLSVGSNGGSGAQFRQTDFNGTLLSDLSTLRYSTYTSNDGSAPMTGDQTAYLILSVDLDSNGTEDTLLQFDPEYQHGYTNAVPDQGDNVLNTWQTWNARAGGWWSTTGAAGATPGAGVKPLSTIFAAYPDARIHNSQTSGSLRIIAGFAAGPWNNFVGNVDDVQVGVRGARAVYNFDTPDTTPPTVLSVNRRVGNPNPVGAGSFVQFTVTFSEIVTGVNAADFAVATTGSISGATVTGVSGSGATRTVTVSTGTGHGTVRLDVLDDDSIRDVADNPLGGPGAGNGAFNTGQAFSVQPSLSVSDVAQAEGHSGTTAFTFTVTLSAPAPADVTFDIATSDSTAQDDNPAAEEDNDYTARSLTAQTIPAGQTTYTFDVQVNGNTTQEANEFFFVTISSPSGAVISDSQGQGTILNDDGAPSAGQIIISEFRLRGPDPDGDGPLTGSDDEFIELYNATDADFIVADSSPAGGLTPPGWAVVSSDAQLTPKAVVPAGLTIPARGHLLVANTVGYSLSLHPSGLDENGATTASEDVGYNTDIPDGAGLALYRTTNPALFAAPSERLDAVGFDGSGLPFVEGTGLQPSGGVTTPAEHSFVRRLSTGLPQDTEDNSADFVLVSTDGEVLNGVQSQLGAPGPQNTTSPVLANSTVKARRVDATRPASAAPNRERLSDCLNAAGGDPCPATAPNGTLVIRRRFANNTGAQVSRLRLRVVDITTLGTPDVSGGDAQADLRVLSSVTATVKSHDPAVCPDGEVPPGGCDVVVSGLTLETPPGQPSGGGLNSTLSLPVPLAPGGSVDVQVVLGVVRNGRFSFFANVEALGDAATPPSGAHRQKLLREQSAPEKPTPGKGTPRKN